MKTPVITHIKLLLLLQLAVIPVLAQSPGQSDYKEPYRPQYHFSPASGWIGDPCGFIYYQHKYQMFWWGKVTSEDLVHYKEESPKVMTGDNGEIAYFTGSMVVDKDNTAGFGHNSMVAAYTIFEKSSEKQSQGISYSLDGKQFQYYEKNPVLDIDSKEFRDPTVFWHAPSSKWIMVVALAREKKIKIYGSADLKKWTWLSDFGPAGAHEKVWECPDLFQLPVDGNPAHKKWVMVISIDWNREQYFIGDFNGTTFTIDADQPKEPLYVDQGLDFYASRTFRDYDNTLSSVTSMGWIATWDYATLAPSSWGKGFWSIPRDLALRHFPEGIRLVQQPVDNLKQLRKDTVSFERKVAKGSHTLTEFKPGKNVYEMVAVFSTDRPDIFGLDLCVGDGRKVSISYNTRTEMLHIDRTHCSYVPIEKFDRSADVLVKPVNKKIRMHFFVDKSSVELFTNEGKEVFTLLTYPAENQTGIRLFSENGKTKLNFKGWNLNSVW